MATKPLPDPELLRKLLRYDPETGKLFWRHRPREMFSTDANFAAWNGRFENQEALTAKTTGGYLHGHILYAKCRAHRVIWAISTGKWPVGEIDHINGDTSDNRICNLEDVSHARNGRNMKRPTTSTSGVIGVTWCKQTSSWRATIRALNKHKSIGRFVRFEDAVDARKRAEADLKFHPNHGRD